jgi:hypothetical protein
MLLKTLKLRPQPSEGQANAGRRGHGQIRITGDPWPRTLLARVAVEMNLMILRPVNSSVDLKATTNTHLEGTGPVEGFATIATFVPGWW